MRVRYNFNMPLYKNHAVLLVAALASIVLLFTVLIVYVLSLPSGLKPVKQEIGSVIRTNPTPNIKDLKKVQAEFFELAIPTNWNITTVGFDGGFEYTLKPGTLSSDKLIPGLQIEMHSKNLAITIDFRKKMYRQLGYKESNTSLGNNSAVIFVGTLPSQVQVGGNGKDAKESVYLVEKEQKLFVISYKYDGTENIGQAEFETILAGLSFLPTQLQ